MKRLRLGQVVLLTFVASACYGSLSAAATQTRILLSSSQDLWSGYPEGATVTSNGVLTPGPAFRKALDLPSLPLCAASTADALWVGTGTGGNLLEVKGGKVRVAHHFEEHLVTALAVLPGGDLLVGTSGPAKVYRYDPAAGKAALVADLKADYCWALLSDDSGLLAATGGPGHLALIKADGSSRVILDPKAAHVRCLLKQGGTVWAGTSTPAALFRIKDGKAYLEASFKQEEVAVLAAADEGILMALNAKVQTSPSPAPAQASSVSGDSVLALLEPGHPPRQLESFTTPILALASLPGACAAGLGDGRLFLIRGGRMALAAHWEDAPVAAIASGEQGISILTAEPPALYLPASAPAKGTYVSPVADFGSPSLLGRAEVEGRSAALFLRAGNSAKPGPFWSGWVPAASAPSLPLAQYGQWKVELETGGECRGVSLAYGPQNRPPFFKEASVHAPGEVLVKMPSQLGDHLVREVHEKDSVFPALAESTASDASPQLFYLQGFRMVAWKVEDPDGDEVRVSVQVRPGGSTSWLTLAERVKDSFYDFDARILPDGVYRARLTADDAASNPEGGAQQAVLDLPDFVVDNTPPKVDITALSPASLRIVVTDNTSVQAVRVSVDGKPWQVLAPVSGTPGSARMEFRLDLHSASPWIAVQAVDAYKNEASAAWVGQSGGR